MEIPFSEIANEEMDDLTPEEQAERLRIKFNPEGIARNEMKEEATSALLEYAKKIIQGNKEEREQGERDWEIFTRYLTGQPSEVIAEMCPWLRNSASVDQTIIRIITKLREHFGEDVRLNGQKVLVKSIVLGYNKPNTQSLKFGKL
jgi:hypothetical protein